MSIRDDIKGYIMREASRITRWDNKPTQKQINEWVRLLMAEYLPMNDDDVKRIKEYLPDEPFTKYVISSEISRLRKGA